MASSERQRADQAAEIDRLATALARDPKSKAFMPLAEAYIKAGMWAEASVVLEDGLKVYPGFVTAMAALGRVYEQLNQPVKAKAILEEVVRTSPDNLRAHRVLAKLYATEGRPDPALRSCAAILAVSPYDEEALSIKRRLTGVPAEAETPRSKRDRKRTTIKPAVKMEADTWHEGTPSQPREVTAAAVAPAPDETGEIPAAHSAGPAVRDPIVPKHAATIARLEAWLRLIQSNRSHHSSL
jgi:tetratricopeptide (TPR) repeat protein